MPLRLVKYPKRSEHWYLRGTVRGESVFESTKTSDRATAEILRIKREAQLLNRSILGPGATITFPEAAASYIDEGGEARFLGNYDPETKQWSGLVAYFVKTPVGQIAQSEIDKAALSLLPLASNATR